MEAHFSSHWFIQTVPEAPAGAAHMGRAGGPRSEPRGLRVAKWPGSYEAETQGNSAALPPGRV